MVDRKSFLLRLPPDLMDELHRWSKDELRSLNAQIEYVLRDAVRKRRKGCEADERHKDFDPSNSSVPHDD